MAVRDEQGQIQTNAQGIAAAVAAHWRQVFGSRPLDEQAVQQ